MAKDKSDSYLKRSAQIITQRILTGTFLVFPFVMTVLVVLLIQQWSHGVVKFLLVDFFSITGEVTWNPLLSVFIAIGLLYIIGMLSTLFIVRKFIGFGESLVRRIPVVNFVYNTTKQIADTLSVPAKQSFKKVVMVEYPRRGIYALAFMTGQTPNVREEATMINIFLPTTPNPTSGFFLLLPRSEVFDTNLTVEEGVKMIISGGILTPRALDFNRISEEELKEMRKKDEEASQVIMPSEIPLESETKKKKKRKKSEQKKKEPTEVDKR